MEGWTKYFKVVGIKPGPVITRLLGPIDFSNPSLPVEKIQALYEADSPYLKLTPEGERELYGIGIKDIPTPAVSPAAPAAKRPEPETASGPGTLAVTPNDKNPDDSEEAAPDDDGAVKPERRRGSKKKTRHFFDPIEPGPEDLM